jgi:hypothetical protein
MKKVLEFYHRAYVVVCQLITICVPVFLLQPLVLSVLKEEYVTTGITFAILLIWLPLALIGTGLFKGLGMSAILVNLSKYKFGTEKFEDDFEVTVTELHKIQDWLEKGIKDGKTTKNNASILTLARDLAIEHDLSPRMYLALLAAALLVMGEKKDKNTKLADIGSIRSKIKDLKQKLADAPGVMIKKSDPDKPEGKYDFI